MMSSCALGRTYVRALTVHLGARLYSCIIGLMELVGSSPILEVVLNDPPQGVYFPGSEVSGILKVQVRNEATRHIIKKIQATLVGLAYVSTQLRSERQQDHRVFTSNEICINLRSILWMKEEVPTQELHAGINSFPFRFQLPTDGLPSSFEGSIGWIRYYVGGRIGTTVSGTHTVKTLITVVEVVDVNDSQTPLRAMKQKTLCCLMCVSAPTTLTVELPRHGFCCGDIIPLMVTCSSRQLRLRAQLLQVIVFRGEGNHRHTEKLVACSAYGQLGPRNTWNPELAVRAPGYVHIVPTLRSCGIININYILKVSAIGSLNLITVHIPVKIGNVPLRIFTGAPHPVPMMVQPQAHVSSQPASSVYPAYVPSHQPPHFGSHEPESSTAGRGEFQSTPPPSYEDVVANPNTFN